MSTIPSMRRGEQCVFAPLSELLLLSKKAKGLPLTSLLSKKSPSGQPFSRLFGRGMEFVESRRYLEGDDIRSIDWRVTARTGGKMHTKLFAAEKEREVLICVDMRSSMFFATKGVFKSVQAALMAGGIAWSAMQHGNRLGGVIFDDESQEEFRPALGKRGVLPFLHKLAERQSVNSNIDPDKKGRALSSGSMDHAIQSIKRVAGRGGKGSLIFLISDFRKFSKASRDLLIQISHHNDLCLCFLYDPIETALPKNGDYPVSDGRKDWVLNTYDKKKLEHYQKQFIERRGQAASLAQKRHIQFHEFSTEEDCFKRWDPI